MGNFLFYWYGGETVHTKSFFTAHCQWPVLLPFDVDDPGLLPLCIGCELGVAVLLHVELSVPGPHPTNAVEDGGGVTVLLVGFVAFPSEFNTFGEVLRVGSVPLLLLGFVALPIVPGGTLIMLPGGIVPVPLPEGSAFVTFLTGLNMLVFPGVPVLLPDRGRAFPAGVGTLVWLPPTRT